MDQLANVAACLPQNMLEDDKPDVWAVKEVRYLGSTEYNLFMYPAGNKMLGVCIGGFPCLEELKKLGDMLKGELESGRELSETFVDGARQIIAAIEAAGA